LKSAAWRFFYACVLGSASSDGLISPRIATRHALY
ncbi:MAG: hypothetical protein ACI9RY_001354, partial [Reinekea sp.]